jgi:hypothetical protein
MHGVPRRAQQQSPHAPASRSRRRHDSPPLIERKAISELLGFVSVHRFSDSHQRFHDSYQGTLSRFAPGHRFRDSYQGTASAVPQTQPTHPGFRRCPAQAQEHKLISAPFSVHAEAAKFRHER